MKFKINIFLIAIFFTIIVFVISTYLQKKLINYEPKISCLVLAEDIEENELALKSMFKTVDIPISIIANQRIVSNFEEIDGLYAKDNIKKSQIVMRSQFDTKENLAIYEADEGKEKISIKIKNAENGVSFKINENSFVNVYVTIRNELAKDFLLEKDRLVMGDEFDGYTVIKLLENVKVLGIFTVDGIEIKNSDGENADTILIAVSNNEAKEINLLRDFASFNITGVNNVKTEISKTEDAKSNIEISGEEN